MFILDLIFAFIFALILVAVLVAIFGRRYPGQPDPWPGALFLFLIIFLMAWAGGIWLAPIEAYPWGGTWLPILLVALFIGLLLAAVLPPERPPRTRSEAMAQAEEATAAEFAIGAFFWILIVALIIGIIFGYAF